MTKHYIPILINIIPIPANADPEMTFAWISGLTSVTVNSTSFIFALMSNSGSLLKSAPDEKISQDPNTTRPIPK